MPDPYPVLMSSKQIVSLVGAVFFLLLSGFFSLAEGAFTCLNPYRFQVDSQNGRKTAKAVLWLENRFGSALITILIGNNAANVALSLLSTSLFLSFLPQVDQSVASLIGSILVTLLLFFFSETLPKQLAKRIPNKCASFAVYPLLVCFLLFFPVTILFYGISRLSELVFKGKEEPSITEEDFASVLSENEEKGVLESQETDIIQNSFDFGDTSVEKVFTPKKQVYAINLKGITNDALKKELMKTTYSRIPVYSDDPDRIVGVLIVKKYLALVLKDPSADFRKAIEKPFIVSPSILIDDLVEGFRKNRTEMALVFYQDHFVGLITMEDILEELVGPIAEKPGLN
ncbi:MAG: hemolysin family protein [Bacilli bacterium]